MHRPSVLAFLLPLLAFGCAQPAPEVALEPAIVPSAAPEAAPISKPTADVAPGCEALDEEACLTTKGCSPIRGLTAEELAILERPDPVFSGKPGAHLGCRSSEADTSGCKEVETWARSGPGETCYLFGDSCVPTGWQPCKPNAASP